MRANQPDTIQRLFRPLSLVAKSVDTESVDAEESLSDAAIDAALEAALSAPIGELLSISEFAEKLERPEAPADEATPLAPREFDAADEQVADPDDAPAILEFPSRRSAAA